MLKDEVEKKKLKKDKKLLDPARLTCKTSHPSYEINQLSNKINVK
jgi:hypothetical protein